MRSKRSEILGHVDHAGGGLVRGWAADLRATRSRLALDVFRHGVYLGCARAGALRRDLREQGIGDGYYGFVFHSPALAAPDATDGLEVVAPDARRTRLTTSAEAGAPINPEPADQSSVTGVRSLLGPMLEAIARDAMTSEHALAVNSSTSARIDLLFATTSEVSAFAAHIAAKYEVRIAEDFLWHWYLETYGVEQAVRAPLSAKDIEALARARAADHVSEIERHWPAGRRKHQYLWCVHESRRLEVEDCLVDPNAIEMLRAVPWFARFSAFPLSHFMRLARRRHSLLRECAIKTANDRIAFYLALMLLALRDVHYLGLMPALWLDSMLAGRSGSPFERGQQSLFGSQTPLLTCDAYCAWIESLGFDLSTKRFSTFVGNGHRLALKHRPTDGHPVDVQMIGPFRQSLGLAESCRRIARALRATGLNPSFVDYRVGGRPQDAPSEVDIGAFRDARINILHLNAEEVPEAMVTIPGLLGSARTIVIPYWELDRPSRAHRLGLELVEEVWCATHFLTDVFAGSKPVCHIGMSFDDRQASPKATPGLIADGKRAPFVVLCAADALSWLERKNVLGAVTAFQAAFEGDTAARLIVKTRGLDAGSRTSQSDVWRAIVARCAGDPRIQIVDADLDRAAHKALLAGVDCLLSLHRSEGLGLDMLDAMQRGTPVVATAYSGNLDFCDAETAWLVDYDLVPVAPGQYAFVEAGHVWAEPRLDSAVAALRAVRDDAATRAQKTRAARVRVQAENSPAQLAARLSSLLRARLATREAAE